MAASDYNEFTGEILNAKIKEKGLVGKSNFLLFIDNSGLNMKIATQLTTKAELKSEQDKIKTF